MINKERKETMKIGRAAFCAASSGNKGDFSRINCIIYLIYFEIREWRVVGLDGATGEYVCADTANRARSFM